jgi:Domain of unknown function (DUF6265)
MRTFKMIQARGVQVALLAYFLASAVLADSHLQITLVNNSPAEQQVQTQLERLLREYNVSSWIFTREVRIDQGARIPYSHPVLTLDTQSAPDHELLSAFLHEQLHWFEEAYPEPRERAIAELKTLYPDAPGGPPEGARDLYSTYLHLLVCFWEYETMKQLVGAERATAMLAARTYYRWVYRTILQDTEKIGTVLARQGLSLPQPMQPSAAENAEARIAGAGNNAGARIAEARITDLSWLSGCWAAEGGEPGSMEHWLPVAGGTLFGVSRTVRQGKTVAHEFLQIRPDAQGQLVLIALPSGQQEATFALQAMTEHAVTFANPTHDFPQRVIYRLRSPEQLLGRIEGVRNGKERGVDFPMRRVSCDAAAH